MNLMSSYVPRPMYEGERESFIYRAGSYESASHLSKCITPSFWSERRWKVWFRTKLAFLPREVIGFIIIISVPIS